MKNFLTLILTLIAVFNSFSQKNVADFNITDIYGHNHELYADYLNNGKYVFINFFSVGCQSCSELSPVLDTVFRDFGCNSGDVVFLGIDGYYDNREVFEFARNYSMTFPAISGNEGGGYPVFNDYGISYTPYKILINPDGNIIADYPFETTVKYYRDTLLAEGLKMKKCSGNDILFYALNSEKDSIVGNIDELNKTVTVMMPENTDLTQLRAFFVAEANSSAKVNGTEQISGETINDFSQGSVIYEITSEDGNTEIWAVNVSTTSVKYFLQKNVKIFPTLVSDVFFIDFNKLNIAGIQAEIINTEGKIVKKIKLKESVSQINISYFPSGIYFLKIKAGKTFLFKKIIKI